MRSQCPAGGLCALLWPGLSVPWGQRLRVPELMCPKRGGDFLLCVAGSGLPIALASLVSIPKGPQRGLQLNWRDGDGELAVPETRCLGSGPLPPRTWPIWLASPKLKTDMDSTH